jgi:hypothetical protein
MLQVQEPWLFSLIFGATWLPNSSSAFEQMSIFVFGKFKFDWKTIPAVLVEGWVILSCDKLGRIAVPGVAAKSSVGFMLI